MAMVALRTEPNSYAFGFANTFRDLGITANMSLADACRRTTNQNFGSTSCSLPMEYAIKNGIEADVFCIYTDNETNSDRRHPHIALEDYRQRTGINAKMVVFGMAVNNFTVANPDDPGMLDVVGFDTAAPQVVSEFVRD
jgi:60 kDa SS-A/Ro ribonucleoprotein